MATVKKQTFLMYLRYEVIFDSLTSDEQAELLKAMFSYAKKGTPPQFQDRTLAMSWNIIKEQLDYDGEKYQETCEQNSENGKKGGRPPKEKSEKTDRFYQNRPLLSKPTALIKSEKSEKSRTDTDTDTESDTVSESESDTENYLINTPPTPLKGENAAGAAVYLELKKRINALFNRRDTTQWSDKETKALKALAKRRDVLTELSEIETLYNSGYEYRRRDVLTFLNNFSGELDKANAKKPKKVYSERTLTPEDEENNKKAFEILGAY